MVHSDVMGVIQSLETVFIRSLYGDVIPIIAAIYKENPNQIQADVVFTLFKKTKPRLKFVFSVH